MAFYLYKKLKNKRLERARQQHVFDPNDQPIQSQRDDHLKAQPNISTNNEAVSRTSKDEESDHHDTRFTPHRDENEIRRHQEEKRAMRNYRIRMLAGIFFPTMLQSLDLTIIASALTFIASDFNELAQLNWIISAFNLTAAGFIPAWGQLADIFGRYAAIQSATVMVLFGSALCAGAPTTNFPMLVAGRAIQGIGTAGLLILIKIIIADKVSLKDNARSNSFYTLISGVGFGIGPVVGGYLTEVSWRWCFIINIPIAALSLPVAHFCLRPIVLGPQSLPGESEEARSRSFATFVRRVLTIDFGGQFLFLAGAILFVLSLTWAGAYYPWSDAKVIAPLAVGVAFLLMFLIWEILMIPGRALSKILPRQRAMIPIRLLWTRNAGILMYINFITGMAMYAVFYFVDIYFTIVRGFGSGKAGENLLYYLPGIGVGAYTALFACNVWPRQTCPPLLLGTVVEATGMTLLAVALRDGSLPFIYAMLAITGFGTGIRFMPGTLHGVGYYRSKIASIILLMSLSVYIGGTIASTVMLNIFNNKLSNSGINLNGGASSTSSLKSIQQLTPAEQAYLRHAAKDGIVTAFFGITSFMWLGVIAVMFLGNVNIQKEAGTVDVDAAGETDARYLATGAYVSSLFGKRDKGSTTRPEFQEK